MYQEFFHLTARPFSAVPDGATFFAASSIESARETLMRVVERGEGPGLIIGPAGTGKTVLCQVLSTALSKSFHVVNLASARLCTRRALLQNILFELKLPYRGLEEGELRLSLIDHLEPSDECPHGMVLIVDEAQNLPLRLLEEIRMITNLVRDSKPRVRLLLAANSLFEERLASPRLESFNQRLAARCYLQSFSRQETEQYVSAQISAAGGDPAIFADDARRAVFDATDGVPRLINQVCDHALVMAAVAHQSQISAAVVEEAWADLQQLPAPWNAPEEGEIAENILEFGPLDDLSDHPTEEAIGSDEPTDSYEDQLEQIEDHLSQVEAPLGVVESQPPEDDFRPAGTIGPEVEMVFHSAHDPFNEPFEEEEIIVDRSEARQADAEKRQAGQATDDLTWAETATPQVSIPAESDETPINTPRNFDPASDPVLPDDNTAEIAAQLTSDDRDIILVQDETEEEEPARPATAVKQFSQLFASLRQQ